MLLQSVRLVMVHTSEEITQTRGNIQKKKIRIKKKRENKYLPTEHALPSLKHPLLNCPNLSVKVLDKLRCILMEQAVVAWSSQKTGDSNRTART